MDSRDKLILATADIVEGLFRRALGETYVMWSEEDKDAFTRTVEEFTKTLPVPQAPREEVFGDDAAGLLSQAASIVAGARSQSHGDKERSFTTIAAFWTDYLQVVNPNIKITAEDVGWMMVMLKVARRLHGECNRDHYVDAAGYAGCAGEIGLAGR